MKVAERLAPGSSTHPLGATQLGIRKTQGKFLTVRLDGK